MKLIVVTGKSGCGKSTVAKLLSKQLGAALLQLDEFSHESLLDPEIKNKLARKFGKIILTGEVIDRKKLGKLAFSDPEKLNFLNELSWKFIDKKMDEFLENTTSKFVILDYALLPKMKYFNMAHKKILVEADKSARFARLTKRDGVDEGYLELREKNGLNYDVSDFDFVIKNDSGDIQKLEAEVKILAKKIQI